AHSQCGKVLNLFVVIVFCRSPMVFVLGSIGQVQTHFLVWWPRKQLEELQEAHMLRGQAADCLRAAALLSSHDLPQALAGAFFVQESVFEEIEDKQIVFQVVESHVGEAVILSSLLPSNVFSQLQNQKRCIISQPFSDYHIKLVERMPRVCKAVIKAKDHCYLPFQDGVISVKHIDLVMSEGLGMCYAFIGPMETMHLKVSLEGYLQCYREGMRSVLIAFGPVPEFSGEAAERINKIGLCVSDPQHLSARRERRDQLLMGLAKLKK
uniref:3-hydroxyacyl-CoA dehydrogenase NAD binding domain-containing protein n=1 Tax=Oncorhynchus kisutch TaxID=8019 RepID=A0A8C7GSX6_ONCKI